MNRIEVTSKIVQIIDKLPDSSLEAIYEIFRKADEKKNLTLESNLNKILKEDSELLQKLAR